MALIDELRKLAAVMPPSHVPAPAELANVVGALVTLFEHGNKALDDELQADAQKLSDLLAGGASSDPAPAAPAPAPASADTSQEDALRAENAELSQQLQTALASLATAKANADLAQQASASQPSEVTQ